MIWLGTDWKTMMHDLEEFLKDLLLIMWVVYVTIMCVVQLFDVESFLDVFILFMVWTWITAFSCNARYW